MIIYDINSDKKVRVYSASDPHYQTSVLASTLASNMLDYLVDGDLEFIRELHALNPAKVKIFEVPGYTSLAVNVVAFEGWLIGRTCVAGQLVWLALWPDTGYVSNYTESLKNLKYDLLRLTP